MYNLRLPSGWESFRASVVAIIYNVRSRVNDIPLRYGLACHLTDSFTSEQFPWVSGDSNVYIIPGPISSTARHINNILLLLLYSIILLYV